MSGEFIPNTAPASTGGNVPTAATTLPPETKGGVPIVIGAGGLLPANIDDLWRLSQMFAQSELVPKDYRNKPGNCAVAIQYGMEVGLPPMQALQSIAVINGRPCIWGDAALALVWRSGLLEEIGEMDLAEISAQKQAVCVVKRKGALKARTVTFTYQDAVTAKLWGKEGPWTQYPPRMCQMRARSFALRDTFPDVLKGLVLREEAEDTAADEPRNITPQAVPVPMPTAAPVAVAAEVVEPEPVVETPTPTPAKGKKAKVVATPPPPPEPTPEPEPATDDDPGAAAVQMTLDTIPGATVTATAHPVTTADTLAWVAEWWENDPRLVRPIMLSGKPVKTAGAGVVTFAKLIAAIRRFDQHFNNPGQWCDAAAMCLGEPLPSVFHVTEESASKLTAYLTAPVAGAK